MNLSVPMDLKMITELGDEFIEENTPRIEVSGNILYDDEVSRETGDLLVRRLRVRTWASWGGAQQASARTCGKPIGTATAVPAGYECSTSSQRRGRGRAADIFCVTCKTPIRASEKDQDEHKQHEVTPLSKALESAR